MKPILTLPIAMLMLGAFTSSGAVEIPTQKPGLWKVTMSSLSMPGGSQSYSMCQDAAHIAAGKSAVARMKKDCSRYDIRKEGDSWITDMECTSSGSHDVTHSVTTVHGDDTYHTEMSLITGKTRTVMTMDHKWLGACKPGQKVGVPIR